MTGPNFDREEILRTLRIFRQPGEVLEMRIPKAGRSGTISGYYQESGLFVDGVIGLADQGFVGIYFTINPVNPDLLARAANRYVKYAETTTSDVDIIALHWLPIDLDAKRPAGISSTDEEHAAAISKAREVRQWLIDEQGWPANAFVLADSGNGAHLPARIDLPNTPESVALVKRCLTALNAHFPDAAVHVDIGTFNPARIWKLYGTMARKGDSTPERPHRLAKILEAPSELTTVSREQLEALANWNSPNKATNWIAEMDKASSSGFNPKQYAEAHGAHVLRVDTWTDPEGGKWDLAILEECPFDSSHNRGEARVGVREDGKRTFRCFHNSCQGKDWQALRDLWEPGRAQQEHYRGPGPMGTSEPHIKAVSLDDFLGAVGLDSDFTIKIVECDKEGHKKLAWLSDCALCIHTETISKDATEFIFKGVGAKDHRQVSFTLPAVALSDPRKFKAALINAFGAKNRVGKLDFETVQRLTMDTRLLKRVEVPVWDENIPFLPGVGLVASVEYRLSSKIPAAVYDGDLQAAKETLQKLLKVHKFAPILVASILGSPAIARWHKNDRFGLGLWGGTGTLKTSTTLAAMGIYGTGYLDGPKLKAGKAGSTIVGANEVFAAAGFLPQIYDDVKTVDSKDSAAYVATVHAVLEGEEKARGKKDGGLRDGREFLCTPIITGEVRPSEASTSARIFNLNWTRSDDKLLSEVQQNAALLPVIGYHWLRFLADTDFILGKDFEAFRSKKMEEFLGLKYVNPGRLATIYALLVGVWDLLETSPLGDVFTEARESFKAALVEATATQGQAVSEETELSRFLNGLEELTASNPGLIMSKDGKKTIVGSIIGKQMHKGLFLLPTETLNELGKIKAFSQQPTIDSITQALNEKNFLIPDKDGHLKYRCRLNDGNPRGWYIKAEAFPQKTEVIPPTGNAKNDINKSDVPTIPAFPQEKRERNFYEDLQKNHDRFDHEKQNHKSGGNNGNSGNIDSIDRLVDSDFDSKVNVPGSVPTVPVDANNDCGKEQPTQGAAQPGDSSEKVVTSRAEKARLWDSIRSKLKKCARGDGKRQGLAVVDLQPDEVEAVKAAGWTQETTPTGISILWATEKSLAAMGLEAGA